MSPTKRPFQPTFLAFVANRSMKRTSCGLPQLRLRDGRMTCQVGPVIGSDSAPARQPLKSPPIERGGPHRVKQVLLLRDGGARGGNDEDGEEANDGAHAQLHSVRVCRKLES